MDQGDCLAFIDSAILHHLLDDDDEKNSNNSYYHYLIGFGLISMESPSVAPISTDFPSKQYLGGIEPDSEQDAALGRCNGLPAQQHPCFSHPALCAPPGHDVIGLHQSWL